MSLRRWLHCWAGLWVLGACGGNGPERPPPPPPEQYVFALDFSGSISPGERSANAQLLAAFTRTLSYGDRLVVMEAHARGRRGTPQPFVGELPKPEFGRPTEEDSITLSGAIQIAQTGIQRVLAAPVANGTDLFATLHSAAERAREAPGRKTTLVMMSDMLQCADGSICMEENGEVPDSAWIAEQKSKNALPDLSGTCVVVVGADASTPHGQRVRDFWIAYFQATGAQFRPEKYSYQVTAPENLAC